MRRARVAERLKRAFVTVAALVWTLGGSPAAAQQCTAGIQTVAGTVVLGDGGPATEAVLNFPNAVAVDTAGNLYIADTSNNRVRKVNTAGGITTVAGTGVAGSGGDCGPATAATLNGPFGVAVDSSGNFYIADSYNNRIRKVTTAGIITTVAGSGVGGYRGDGGSATAAELYWPGGVALDAAGNLYIADSDNSVIRHPPSMIDYHSLFPL